jgi:hypothetical protein
MMELHKKGLDTDGSHEMQIAQLILWWKIQCAKGGMGNIYDGAKQK